MIKIITSKRFKSMQAKIKQQEHDVWRLKKDLQDLQRKYEQQTQIKDEALAKRKKYAEEIEDLKKRLKKSEDDKAKAYKENRHYAAEIRRALNLSPWEDIPKSFKLS